MIYSHSGTGLSQRGVGTGEWSVVKHECRRGMQVSRAAGQTTCLRQRFVESLFATVCAHPFALQPFVDPCARRAGCICPLSLACACIALCSTRCLLASEVCPFTRVRARTRREFKCCQEAAVQQLANRLLCLHPRRSGAHVCGCNAQA